MFRPMNATALPTPAELSITPRDRRFGRHAATPRLWHGGRVEATAIYNALSTTFPAGEAFFVESVRAFRAGTPPELSAQIKAFTTQEAIHSREHDAFNKRAADAGYDLSKLEAQVDKRLAVTRNKPPVVSLAATMALEHFTAILAHELLADPRHLEGADRETADLWRWHAAEEIEHKAVAFDVMKHLRAGYWRQVRTQLVVTPMMLLMWVRGVRFMYSVDPHVAPGTKARWRDYFKAARRGLVPGPLRFIRVIGSYYKPNFHPSQLGGVERAVDYLAISAAARASH